MAAAWNCSGGTGLSDVGEQDACSSLLESAGNQLRKKLLSVDALQVTCSILAGVIVGMGACGRRYRHRPSTSFIYLGATILFLPVISYVVSICSQPSNIVVTSESLMESFLIAQCYPYGGGSLIWAFLFVLNIMVVAMDDREGPNIRPPFQLLAQGVWAVYLGTLYVSSIIALNFHHLAAAAAADTGIHSEHYIKQVLLIESVVAILFLIVAPFALTSGAKIMLKYHAFRKAQRSSEFGHNPLVVFGYMQQLQQQDTIHHGHGDLSLQADDEDSSPPPLLVTGEGSGGHSMEMKSSGYVFYKDDGSAPSSAINDNNTTCSSSLVTLDRIWQQYRDSSMLHPPMSGRPQQLKDLCLSFALFKLLRCRFARYKLTNNAGSTATLNFFWSLLLLKDGQHARVFGVIADELSFLNDYYYSSFTISYSRSWLTILCTVVSLLSCMIYLVEILFLLYYRTGNAPQLTCRITCIQGSKVCKLTDSSRSYGNGNYFVMVPTLVLFALVIVTEVREMVSYICSNWTKIALIHRTVVNNASSSQQQQQHHSHHHHSNSLLQHMQKCVGGLLLRCRCKLLNHWDGKMGQCSVLVTTTGSRATPSRLRHLLGIIPDRKRRVKVPEAVKFCIINALRSSDRGRRLSNGRSSLGRTQDGKKLVWACDSGQGTCDTILTWHIATCILEVMKEYPYRRDQEQDSSPPVSSSDGNKIAATYLSRYCVYLVAKFPELLPDNDVWIKGLYKAVKKDVERTLAGHAVARRSPRPEDDDYQKLVHLLTENSKHEVLKNGVKLAKQLVETINGEETAWKLLADFWSEMILFVAPSDNLKAHSEAVARGGELITLLWALLFHAGIVSRPGEEDGAAAASAGGAV